MMRPQTRSAQTALRCLRAPAQHGPAASKNRSTLVSCAPTTATISIQRTQTRAISSQEPTPNRPPSNEERLGRSFTGQMMGSIGQRLERERADRQRWRKDDTAPSKMWYTTFLFLFATGSSYYLGGLRPHPPSEESTLPLGRATMPQLKANVENMQAAWVDFVTLLGEGRVSTEKNDLDFHSTSSWSAHQAKADDRPFMVLFPQTTQEVSDIMKICHKRHIPVVGFSGGTSLEGHYTPTHGGVCVDFTHMNKIVALHKDDLDVVVQPGVGGTNAYRYGTMREWVLSVTAVLADGTIVKTRQRARKSSAGYDLTKVFIGSEGTLGLVTEATLKLAVVPEHTSVAVASFPTIRDAANCVGRVVSHGIPVAAVEILDDNQMQCINQAGMTSRKWAETPTLFFKFSGTERAVKEQIETTKKLSKQAQGKSFEFAKSVEEQHELWSARKEALWSTMAVKKEGDRVWTGDVAVPMTRLPDLIEETKISLKKSGLFGSIVGHVGDGNFHLILLYNDAQRKIAEGVVHDMVKRAVEMEGTVTGEHGVGLVKRDYLPHELGQSTVDLMRKMKTAFDPLCLLNCDKVIRMNKPKPGDLTQW
ncbi:D-lactate dehydrogenase cytochrome, mitochondrial [Ceratocystis lukuohia]|uniref:D-lactate dehydrogenase cytochrome, mitochondrial n=1 Tax=Ceratocystis lukuohia TaxID=2019550 RepID=A0ABR4MRY5_9PEZI